MIYLNSAEMKIYKRIIDQVIPRLAPGNYFAREFFDDNVAVPRIVRHIYEECKAGNLSGVFLIANKSSEGYRINETTDYSLEDVMYDLFPNATTEEELEYELECYDNA